MTDTKDTDDRKVIPLHPRRPMNDEYESQLKRIRQQMGLSDDWRQIALINRIQPELMIAVADLTANQELTDAQRWQSLMKAVKALPYATLDDHALVTMGRTSPDGEVVEDRAALIRLHDDSPDQ
ncbi:MAG: hypothetical protein AWU57_493 [Marinobacter sp. T13-3]|nr:MAG: hypothetical protein AWU57_493 [Marinobacter sp. T13-3]